MVFLLSYWTMLLRRRHGRGDLGILNVGWRTILCCAWNNRVLPCAQALASNNFYIKTSISLSFLWMDLKKYEPIKNIHFENTNLLLKKLCFLEWENSIKFDACLILNCSKFDACLISNCSKFDACLISNCSKFDACLILNCSKFDACLILNCSKFDACLILNCSKFDACIILNCLKQCNSGLFWTVRHSSGTLGMYVGGVCFESRLEHRLYFLRLSSVPLSQFRASTSTASFLNPLEFIFHRPTFRQSPLRERR